VEEPHEPPLSGVKIRPNFEQADSLLTKSHVYESVEDSYNFDDVPEDTKKL
jgi:hypothetical protein